MKWSIEGAPAFAHIQMELEPGESIVTESGAMASMSAELDMKAEMNGNLFSALAKKFLGGESFFISTFANNSGSAKKLTITQGTPGDIRAVELKDSSICLQPGAYIACTSGIKLRTRFAGIGSLIAREGLFRLEAEGTGTLWFGAYGGLIEKEVKGSYIVDTAHLVSYDRNLKLKTQLSGDLISSLTSGEGFVTRIEGNGKIILQTRSMHGLTGWINRYI